MKKLIYFILITFILLFAFHRVYYYEQIEDLNSKLYETKSNELIKLFEHEVEKKFGKTFALTYLLSKDEKLTKALLKNDNKLLDYKETIEDIQNYGEYKNLWIQIIDKDGYSFYRSWTNKVGDHAASARLDIVDMMKNPRPMRGISTGRFDMTFKTMIPLFYEDKFIGIVEIISKFNSIAKVLERNEVKPLIVLREEYTDRFIKAFTGLFIGRNYVANLNASKDIMKKAEVFGLEKLMYLEKPLLIEDHLVFTTQIKDIHGGEMGFVIFFYDEKKLDKSIVYNFKTTYLVKVIIFLIIFILLILYLFYRNYAKQLNKEVELKTSKIRKQQKKLSELFKTYDDSVIFSKSDLKGNITYVSKAFCDISGYTKEELIGKPHNIIRHKDTQSSVFKEMWEIIQSGKTWKGEIKNLKKDGSYYWVDAVIDPIFDEKKNIIGYISKRNDITSKKEFEEQQQRMLNQSKLAAMGEMIGNIAHQWKQPLSVITTISTSISLKQEMNILKESEIKESMEHITKSAHYLSNTIETFRNFLKDKKELKNVYFLECLNKVVSLISTTLYNNNIKLVNKIDDEKAFLYLVSGELEEVMINIINNSKDAFLENKIKDPIITVDLIKDEKFYIITLEDNAGGIPEEILPKIFDSYFTTKKDSEGTGLGLSMSYKIVTESLGGKFYAENTNHGAKFFIKLPFNS